MHKLLAGIRDFHERVRPTYRERFAHLALGQSPDCLFIACSDSRVVPNLFASTDPGDLFVLRNVGNIVPPCGEGGVDGDECAGAAVEFATLEVGVRDVVVCGHSSCGAMRAALGRTEPTQTPNLDRWLTHTGPSIARLGIEGTLDPALPDVDRLSQAHVLQQLDHLHTYPVVHARVGERKLRLHAWWFDLANAQVLAFDASKRMFVPLVDLIP